ncbi:toll/interleukin-1 receptor domain-containing protein [Paenibacillus phytohabitans]|uniref:toll/interleukin-1 receptor domain-containing protein n=1 Tax=Paenibacillus phytohabitans TaxID=2654978 RepID=UPI00300857B7
MTKVFISHKAEDAEKAQRISLYLQRQGIAFYLDLLDDGLFGDGEILTNHLRSKLNECTHLLAVITNNTKFSWWVPFEIGLATERQYPISSFVSYWDKQKMPDYLWKWPVLETDTDLNNYIALLKRDHAILLSEEVNKSFSYNKPKNYAEAFQKRMKQLTGQIR